MFSYVPIHILIYILVCIHIYSHVFTYIDDKPLNMWDAHPSARGLPENMNFDGPCQEYCGNVRGSGPEFAVMQSCHGNVIM